MNSKNARVRENRGTDAHYLQKEEESQIKYGRLINVFEILSRFPLTSKGTNQLHDLLATMGVYTTVEQRVETARLLLTSYVILISSIVIIYYMSDNLVLRMGAVVIALIFRRDFVNKKIRKERVKVWKDVYRSMTSLKNEFERLHAIQKAFNKAVVEDKAKLLFGSVSALFRSKEPAADLAYFNQNNANQIFQRFADLAFNCFYNGVAISPVTKLDTFTSNMDIIMRDLQVEIDLAEKEKKRFYMPEKLPLVMLLVVALAPGFLTSRYPGMHYFYNGALGYLSLILSMLLIALGYLIASSLNDNDKPLDDRLDFEIKLFLRPKFKSFWEDRIPKFNRGVEDLLNESLSFLSPAQYKFRQVYISFLCGFFALVSTIAYVVILKETSVVDLAQLPRETMDEIVKEYESPDIFAEKYVMNYELSSKEALVEELKKEKLKANDTTVDLIADIILKNRNAYLNANYSPLYLFGVLAAMIVGFNIPQMLLKRRRKIVEIEVQFEILVIYAVAVQMMYTPMKLKDYLKRFVYISRLYPKTHLDSYINHFNNPIFIKEKALLMRNPQYYDFMEKLYTLRSDKKAPDVFRELERKREYFYEKVLEMRELRMENNYHFLKIVVFAVMIVIITLQVIVPMAQFSLAAIAQYGKLM